MRTAMPEISAWIDELRRVFGRAAIDAQLRRGLRGEVAFWAKEGEHELGAPSPAGVAATPIPMKTWRENAER